jgi:hypothetical protein
MTSYGKALMKKQACQDDEEEQPCLRKIVLQGLVSSAPQQDTPDDQADTRAIACDEDAQRRALQQKFIAAFHARVTAAAADLECGGKTNTPDEVMDEMRAKTAARRREHLKGCFPVKRWSTATEAADLVGVSRIPAVASNYKRPSELFTAPAGVEAVERLLGQVEYCVYV